MSKKKKIIIVLALISIIIVSFLGGQSFSKYASQAKGQAVADIATWSFKVNGKSEQIDTVDILSTYDNQTLVQNKVAPGTQGSFNITIDAEGAEVGINYKVEFANERNKPSNMKFICEGQEYSTLSELQNALTGTIAADSTQKTKVYTIEWRWNYETGADETQIARNDKLDTQDGIQLENYTCDIIVSGTQVMPQG